MKKILKLILSIGLLISLIFFSLSFVISNEKSLDWLISNFWKGLGYQSEITFISVDWGLYKSSLKIDKIQASSKEIKQLKSILAEEVILDINILDLFFLENFLKAKVEKVFLGLGANFKSEEFLSNKFLGFMLELTSLELKEVNLKGSINELDIEQYFYLFSGPEKKKNFSNLFIKDLHVKNLKLGPFSLSEIDFNMQPTKRGLKFNLSNSDLDGSVNFDWQINRGLDIDLNHLTLHNSLINSEEKLISYLLDNLQFPIFFSSRNINLNGRHLGQWKFSIKKIKKTLFFDQIEGSYRSIYTGEIELPKKIRSIDKPKLKEIDFNTQIPIKTSLDKSEKIELPMLSISKEGKKIISTFQGKLFTLDLNKSLKELNETSSEPNFSAKEAYIIPNISWKGLPSEFNLEAVKGTLSFRIDNVLIKEFGEDFSNATGLLKLISLFNVTHTFEGLTNLNFRKNFKSGFQADRAEGLLNIGSKKIETINPIIFFTGSGEFSWNGYVSKTDEGEFNDLNFDIIMTLPIREYLPAYALILGGPITAGLVYVAGKAFEKPLNKLSSGKWRVSGDINNFKTEFLEWFED